MAEYGRVNGRVNEKIAKGVKEGRLNEINEEGRQRLHDVVMVIKDSPGLKTGDMAKRFGVSERTMARYLKMLQTLGIVLFQGVPKKGAYVLTSDFLKDIEE